MKYYLIKDNADIISLSKSKSFYGKELTNINEDSYTKEDIDFVELTKEELEEIKRCLHCEQSIDNSITYAKIRKVLK